MRGSEWQTWAVKGLNMMNRRAWVRTGAAWAAVACMASTPLLASAADMAPDAMIKQLSEEVLNTLKTDQAIRAGDVSKITAYVDRVVMPNVDFRRMMASAVGPKWRTATASQRLMSFRKNSSEPQTQNRLCMEWNLPKQTMNSAVASMVRQGLLELEPAPGRYSGKLLHLTPAGRELAAKTAKPVYSAEQAALEQLGMAEAEHFVRLGQEHLNAIRTEFNKILQQEKV